MKTILRMESPCTESWEGMQGNHRIRCCEKCNRKVFNIANMTESEVISLIDSKCDELCLRMKVASDNTIMTRSDTTWTRSFYRIGMKIASTLCFGLLFIGCRKQGESTELTLEIHENLNDLIEVEQSTFMGTVTPRIIIPEEEEESLVPPETSERPPESE